MLALGAGSLWTFELLEEPMVPCAGFKADASRPNVLTARIGESPAGTLVAQGPTIDIPLGSYEAEVYIRVLDSVEIDSTISASLPVLTLNVVNGTSVLATSIVTLQNREGIELWQSVRVGFRLETCPNVVELRIFWNGTFNVDFAFIKIKYL